MPPPANRIFGFLKSFPKGVNSDVDPLLLPADQLSFARNATVRGDFANPRPVFNTLTLTDNTAGAFQLANTLFQGACYYLPDSGTALIMCAVGGKLFAIDPIAMTVVKIALPDAGNPASIPQAWLWQAESWLIWTDGQSYPYYYDNSTARRSLGAGLVSLGSSAAQFSVPAQNQSVKINLADNWPNGLYGCVLIGDALYDVVGISNTGGSVNYTSLTLAAIVINQAGGTDAISPAAPINLNTAYAGTILAAADINGNAIISSGSLLVPVVGTPPTAFTIPLSGYDIIDIAAWAASYPNPGASKKIGAFGSDPFPVLYAGQVLTLSGISCTVQSVTSSTAAGVIPGLNNTYPAPLVQSVTLVANSAPAAPTPITGNLTIPADTNYSAWYVGGTASGTAPFAVAGTGNIPGISASTNYFYLTLSQSTASIVVGNVLQFGTSANPYTLFTCQVVGNNTASNTVQCKLLTLPGTSTVLAAVLGAATTANIVLNNSANGTTTSAIGVYPSASPASLNVSAVLVMPYTPGLVNAAIGQVVQIPTSNGTVSETDLFQIIGITNNVVGTIPSIIAININDTPSTTAVPNTYPIDTLIYSLPEINAGARMGCYGMGRNWFSDSTGHSFLGGDLVGSASGSPQNNYRDAVLKVSQNFFLAGGGTFSIPGSGEIIRAMAFTAQLDASLGQGPLEVFTEDTVFSCYAPPDMTTWSELTSPILVEGLIGSGAISQDAVAQSNGDLIFRLSDGGIQSMLLARLDFNRWGNTPISKEISRSIAGDKPVLLPFTSMVSFSNRLLTTCQFLQTSRGVFGKAIVALNYDPISSLSGKAPSVWEGEWTGLNALQLVTGFFNGAIHCYALCLSADLTQIQLVEIMDDVELTPGNAVPNQMDNGTTPISLTIESPMIFQKEQSHEYKRLWDGEIYLNEIQPQGATVNAFYKVDQNSVWTPWYSTMIPYQPNDSGFRPRVGLGQPSAQVFDTTNNRPMREGFDFQVKLVLSGCQLLGGRFAADLIPQPEFAQPK